MANGILSNGGTNPAAIGASNTTIYVVPADTFTVATVSMCNRGAADVTVRLAVAASGTPTTADYLEYDATLVPGGVLERTGIVLNAGKYIVAYASASTVSVVAYGIETATA